jgi:hypothetical protein
VSVNRGRGTAFETLIVRYLQSQGWVHAERRALHGTLDKGDITGTGPLVWECKNHKTLDFSGWLKETEQERQNANADHGILVVKRRSYGDPGDQYAIMRLEDLTKLLKEAGYGPD